MEAWRDELYHWGIPGQVHGVRRFQNYDGSLTPEGRARYGVGAPRKKSWKEKRAEKKRAKQRKAALKKANIAKKAKAEAAKKQAILDANKDKVLKSGSASDVMKYKGQLTNDELNRALNRIQWERQLASISAQEKQSNWEKMDRIMDRVGKTADYISTGTRLYDSTAKVYNAFFAKEEKDKLPIISGGNKKK